MNKIEHYNNRLRSVTIQKWICFIGGILISVGLTLILKDTDFVGIPPIFGFLIMLVGGLYFSEQEEKYEDLIKELNQ